MNTSAPSSTDPKVAQVLLSIENNVAHITFDHVAARNAMTVGMYERLRAICLDIATMPTIRVAVLRGAGGKSFVSGSDIAQFSGFRDGNDGIAYEASIDTYFAPLIDLPIPTIAVVDGLAVGGGLAIASCCDFRIATHDARFGVPIARTLGNCLSAGNIAWLVHHLGVGIVKRMLLLAELVPASELLANGFILKTYSAEDMDGAANALASRLSSLAPVTQKVSKATIHRVLRSQLPNCDDLVRECYGSADFKTGVNAFLNGIPPKWEGK
jgi:enoyl-CoA hydratase/carnithine racemase